MVPRGTIWYKTFLAHFEASWRANLGVTRKCNLAVYRFIPTLSSFLAHFSLPKNGHIYKSVQRYLEVGPCAALHFGQCHDERRTLFDGHSGKINFTPISDKLKAGSTSEHCMTARWCVIASFSYGERCLQASYNLP